MKWNRWSRGAVGSVLSLALGLGATACSRDFTVAYLYATAATLTSDGVVNGYQINYQSGSLIQLANSPVPSGGRNPVNLVATPDGKFIYVIHRDDNNVVEFAIGTDGKLYPQHTYSVIGSFPLAAAIDPAGKFLYVISTYQPGFTTARPGPGNITIFPINNDNSLGTASQVNVGNSPVGIVASSLNHFLYVLDRESRTTPGGATSGIGVVLGFSQNPTSGALAPVTTGVNPTYGGFVIGTQPSSIAEDATSKFVYVTDQATNQLYGSIVTAGGALQQMTNSPFATGDFPVNVTIDPRGKYMYVVNYNAGNVQAFAIDQATGTPSGSVGSGSTATKTNPTCATIEPALGIYLFVTNRSDSSISGFQLDPHNGSLKQIQGQPYSTQQLPSCAVAVANGEHATQLVP